MQHLQNTGGTSFDPKAFLFLQLFALFNSSQRFSVFVAARSSIFRTLFQVRYAVTPVFAALAKTAGVYTNNFHSGTRHSPLATILKFFHWPELANRHGRIPSTCFLFNFQLSTVNFQYNRRACVRGRNEPQPAFGRDKNRFRAALLGRQYQRTLRAPLLLLRVRLFGPLPPRSTQLPDGTRDESDRALWRPGVDPGYLRRSRRRSPRFSPRAFPRVPDPCRLVFPARLNRIFVARSGTKPFATGSSRDLSSGSASPRRRTGEALRGRHDRSCLQGKCSLYRLFDLLHAGEHWRRNWTLARRINQRTPADRHRVSDGGAQRLSDVLPCSCILQGAAALRRHKYREHRRDSAQFRQGARQSQIHGFFADFFRLLDRLLAGIHHSAALCPRLHQSRH